MRRASEEPEGPEERGAERRAAEYQDELLGSVAAALGRTVRDGVNAAAAAAQLAAETGRARAKAAPAIAGAVESEVRGAVRKAVSRAETPDKPLQGIDGRDDAKRASQRASSMVDAAATNANRAYWEALQRVRNPANRTEGYEETLRREVARLAREGVTAYSYRRRNPDGTYSIVKVPVDVGLRREIETAGIKAANGASLEAAANGGGLVEVSCTANPRKSHRAWEGRVYRVADPDPSSPLFETVMRYPRFADVVGDHINDYNCRHQVRPWREGQPRWRDPLEGTGYTPEEGSRIMARQAALENEVRKAKREVEALQAAGLDASEAKRRLTARRREVKALVDEHPKLLERRPWREGIYEGARKKDGTYGRVHLSASQEARASGGVAERAMWQQLADMAKVPEGVIGSKSHRALADRAFGAALSESQHKAIERMLRHRDGWLFEDLYAFDLDRGTVIGSVTDQRKRQAVSFTVKLRKAVKKRVDEGCSVAIVHNHPHSSMPSFADVKSLLDSKAKTGVIACHDGSFYAFRKVSEPAPGYNVTEEWFDVVSGAKADRGEEAMLSHIEKTLGVRIEHFREGW